MPTFHLRSPDGRMIDVMAPDQGTAIHMAQQRFASLPAGQEPAPIGGGPARVIPLSPGPHPQGQDWWRSMAGGLVNGVNNVAASVGAAHDTEDHLAEMAAHGVHDAGQTVGLVPKGQPYQPGSGAEVMHRFQDPAQGAAYMAGVFGANPKTQQGVRDTIHNVAAVAAPGTAWSQVHPADVRNAELATARAVGGSPAAANVADVVDYEPQTAMGRALYRASSMAPAALLPGSLTQRALAVAAPTLGSTIGGESARLLGAPAETAANAELIGGLIAAGGGGKVVPLAERGVTNVSDALAGPRAVPTSGETADLIAALKGGSGGRGGWGGGGGASFGEPGAPGVEAPTFKRSDLSGAGKILAQHVARVGRANGEDFGAMAQRVGGMGDQAMLADALQDLARNVADRGSFGQQFLGGQLNNRQLGVFDPATGVYSEPSAAMRLDAARRAALGAPAGAFDTTEALTRAQQANAGPLYTQAHAQPPVSLTDFSSFAESPLWQEAYNRARGLSQVQMVDLPGGGRGIQALPDQIPDALDWRTLDLMKQGIQDKISENTRQGIGAHEQGALKGYLGYLTDQQNALNPTLGEARAAYAGPAQVKDAIDFGRNAYTMDPSELAAELSRLSPSERQGANVGFYQAGRDATLGRSQRLNAAEALGATNPDMMARNQALMGDNFGPWNTTLGNEATFFNTRSRALGGSATSRNMLGAEDAADVEQIHPVEATGALIGALHGEPSAMVETGGNVGKLFGLGKLFAKQPSQMSEGTADVLGTILGTRGAFTDPQTAALIQGLMDSAQGTNYSAGLVRPAALLSAPKNQDQGGQNAP